MAKEFVNGKWIDSEGIIPRHQAVAEDKKPPFIDPRDIEPQPPKSPANDHDRPRWVAEHVQYLEKLSNYRSRQQFKAEHPELKGKSWHVKESVNE